MDGAITARTIHNHWWVAVVLNMFHFLHLLRDMSIRQNYWHLNFACLHETFTNDRGRPSTDSPRFQHVPTIWSRLLFFYSNDYKQGCKQLPQLAFPWRAPSILFAAIHAPFPPLFQPIPTNTNFCNYPHLPRPYPTYSYYAYYAYYS